MSSRWLAGALSLGLSGAVLAASPVTSELIGRVDSLVKDDQARLTKIFKDIHQNPELAFNETRTAGIIAEDLKQLGFTVTTGIAKTGLVAILKNGEGPTVMYRADMDANSMAEGTDLPYASKVRVRTKDGQDVPVGHMCGHDAHVTWMLGMAKAMVAMKKDWSGTLMLVGQPAEEEITGAQAMLDDGFWTKHQFPKPDYFIGAHTAPGPVGFVASSGGAKLAGTDQIDILFKGVGGHGSMPQTTKDPIVMAAHAVVQFQSIVSRTIDPGQMAVLTVGSVRGGNNNNIIPESALVQANLRWYDPKVRQKLIDGIKSVSEGIARTYGMPEDKMPVITFKGHSTPLVNDDALAKRMAVPMKALLGEKLVLTELPPSSGSEDVHILKGPNKDTPFNFLLIGVADPERYAAGLKQGKSTPYTAHSPEFVVELNAIPMGTRIATVAMLELMAKAPAAAK